MVDSNLPKRILASSACSVASTRWEIDLAEARAISRSSEVFEPRVNMSKPASSSPGSMMVVQAAEEKPSADSFCTLTKLGTTQKHCPRDMRGSGHFAAI
ncbi:unannotated protein [freshwater metagenome]|uniref:Unannotated protein n=1 Tax=freshwater metagenome TaxID=449393 RepID=A0A6J7KR78_9ZZZZ